MTERPTSTWADIGGGGGMGSTVFSVPEPAGLLTFLTRLRLPLDGVMKDSR